MGQFYNGTKLLNYKDLDGKRPELFLSTGNRCSGKTTFFNRYLFQKYLDDGIKFYLLCRYKYELKLVAQNFIALLYDFFPDIGKFKMELVEKTFMHVYYIPDESTLESCFYVICLSSAPQIKKVSTLLNDGECILFDEFQEPKGNYLKDEFELLVSIHTSLARAPGLQVRTLPMIFLSNMISLLNPYYSALGIIKRLRPEMKFLRGHGWVLEININKSSLEKLNESFFSKYTDVETVNSMNYLEDKSPLIGKKEEVGDYFGTLNNKGKRYGLLVLDNGFYVSRSYDKTNKNVISCNTESIEQKVLYDVNLITLLRVQFKSGRVLFEDKECMDAFIELTHY